MYSHNRQRINRVVLVCVSLMLVLGANVVGEGADESISAKLEANEGVGVAFNNIRQGFFDVAVSLTRPDDWFIVTTDDSSRVVDKSGETIWCRTSADESAHEWEGYGVTGQSWPGVLFAGNLTRDGAGDSDPPSFDASVADIDIDVDSLALHLDGLAGHWPPIGSVEEDRAKAGDGTGGLYLPASLWAGSFPANLPADTAYKFLVLTLRPHWVGTPSYDGNIGTLAFSLNGSGFALYELTGNDSGTLVSSSIRVPPNGFSGKQYAILTNEDFIEPGSVYGTFEWDSELRGGEYTATDHVRLAPVPPAGITAQYTTIAAGGKPNSAHQTEITAAIGAPVGGVPVLFSISSGGEGLDCSEQSVSLGTECPTYAMPGRTRAMLTGSGGSFYAGLSTTPIEVLTDSTGRATVTLTSSNLVEDSCIVTAEIASTPYNTDTITFAEPEFQGLECQRFHPRQGSFPVWATLCFTRDSERIPVPDHRIISYVRAIERDCTACLCTTWDLGAGFVFGCGFTDRCEMYNALRTYADVTEGVDQTTDAYGRVRYVVTTYDPDEDNSLLKITIESRDITAISACGN